MAAGTILVSARYQEPYGPYPETGWKAKANFTLQDASYQSPSCSSRCTDYDWGDITYNFSGNLWACCGTNEACNKPTDQTFLAPPPQQLLAAGSSQSATTSTPATMSSATTTVTATPSAMVDQTSSLSEGAKAGIGVGAALAATAIMALIAWVILLRKRLRSHGQARYSAGMRDGSMMNGGLPGEAQRDAVREHELSGYSRPHEMEGR